jgi:nucleoside-diphosphate-sugar epimerase
MRVLITGSDGYLGSVLKEWLMSRGYRVMGLDTGFYRDAQLYHSACWAIPPCFNVDTRKVEDFVFDGVDAVVYLSELSNDPLGQVNPEITIANNHVACIDFAKKCIKHGINRFVYSSSCSVYGESPDLLDEGSKTNPLTEYAKCKVLNENSLLGLVEVCPDFCPVILRNGTMYGQSPSMRFDLCINTMCGSAWIKDSITIENEGTAWRPFVHVKDACLAIQMALEIELKSIRDNNYIFNVGSTNENYQIKDIASIIASGYDLDVIKQGYLKDQRNYRVSCDKIASMGYTPEYTVEKGIEELLGVFNQIDLTSEMYENRAFRRIDQIQYLIRTGQLSKELFWNNPV